MARRNITRPSFEPSLQPPVPVTPLPCLRTDPACPLTSCKRAHYAAIQVATLSPPHAVYTPSPSTCSAWCAACSRQYITCSLPPYASALVSCTLPATPPPCRVHILLLRASPTPTLVPASLPGFLPLAPCPNVGRPLTTGHLSSRLLRSTHDWGLRAPEPNT